MFFFSLFCAAEIHWFAVSKPNLETHTLEALLGSSAGCKHLRQVAGLHLKGFVIMHRNFNVFL